MLVENERPQQKRDRQQDEPELVTLAVAVRQRTCSHCGAFAWFYPADLTGSWYRCGLCKAMA